MRHLLCTPSVPLAPPPPTAIAASASSTQALTSLAQGQGDQTSLQPTPGTPELPALGHEVLRPLSNSSLESQGEKGQARNFHFLLYPLRMVYICYSFKKAFTLVIFKVLSVENQ